MIIGPGPGHPDELHHLYPLIQQAIQLNRPILGVCLGHQLLAQYFGAKVIRANAIRHGQISKITLTEKSGRLYRNIPQTFNVTRYHSLVVENTSLPSTLIPLAYTREQLLMSFQHQHYPVYGIQYHPEACLSEHGLQILKNFLF